MKADLKAMSAAETEAWAEIRGLQPYRGRQIRHWLLGRLVSSFEEMTNLPRQLRAELEAEASIAPLERVSELVSEDGTRKLLFRLQDGHLVETILIPERDHFTLCISSQAGCAMGCRFCLTGKGGLKRNLTPSEIIEQIIQAKRSLENPERLTNIVLMGMGEPLANYDSVKRAVENMIAEDGMNLSHRRVTLSTCGLIPQMRRLGAELTVNLAVSLNAADDETRSYLMPVNRRFPLEDLIQACRAFPLPNRRMITFEYVLIRGMNDRPADARRLADLLRGLRAKVNLIPFNPHPGSEMATPAEDAVLAFQQVLVEQRFTAIVRKSKGKDIMAACGQLSGSP